MALNIRNPEVERLAREIADLTGESKTEAIRQALIERRQRLRKRMSPGARVRRLRSFLEREVWAQVPPDRMGNAAPRIERERILGFAEAGV